MYIIIVFEWRSSVLSSSIQYTRFVAKHSDVNADNKFYWTVKPTLQMCVHAGECVCVCVFLIWILCICLWFEHILPANPVTFCQRDTPCSVHECDSSCKHMVFSFADVLFFKKKTIFTHVPARTWDQGTSMHILGKM